MAVSVSVPSDTVYSKVTGPENPVAGISVTIPLTSETLAPSLALPTPTTFNVAFSASVSFANRVAVSTVKFSPL